MENLYNALAILIENFSNQITLQTIIDLGTVILIALINIGFGFYLNERIEDVKLQNKKSEINYQKYQLEQAEVIKVLYSNLIDLRLYTNWLFNESTYKNHHFDFKSRINLWLKNYNSFYLFYKRNRILVNTKLIEIIEVDLKSLQEIHQVLFKEKINIEDFEASCAGQIEYIYNDQYDEEEMILKKLNIMRQNTEEIKNSNLFVNLLSNLENEYIKLLNLKYN